jgi:hypothetical protein
LARLTDWLGPETGATRPFLAPARPLQNSELFVERSRAHPRGPRGRVGDHPTRTLPGLTVAQKRPCVIADDKIAQLAGWEGDLLKAEFEILIQGDFEIETTGFSTGEIDLLLDPPRPARQKTRPISSRRTSSTGRCRDRATCGPPGSTAFAAAAPWTRPHIRQCWRVSPPSSSSPIRPATSRSMGCGSGKGTDSTTT